MTAVCFSPKTFWQVTMNAAPDTLMQGCREVPAARLVAVVFEEAKPFFLRLGSDIAKIGTCFFCDIQQTKESLRSPDTLRPCTDDYMAILIS